MCIGMFTPNLGYTYFDIEYSGMPYGKALEDIKLVIEAAGVVIGFNIKFDLHWIRRYIPDIKFPKVWDCQLAQYILNDQKTPMLALDDCLIQHGLPQKDHTIDTEYWDKGMDTDNVPVEILRGRNKLDCELTYQLYLKQNELLKGNKRVLYSLHCSDLLVLQEMEFNGLKYDTQRSLEEGKRTFQLLCETQQRLVEITGEPRINWNSPQQISAVLYGGTIAFPVRERTERTLKDGTIKLGERNGTVDVQFTRLVAPLPGSELDNGFSTSEPTLRSLRATGKAKKIIDLVLKVSELDKLLGTYYNGLPELIDKMDWEKDTIHGSINQSVTKTGRTSSSKPNLQNFSGEIKPLFYTRYPTTGHSNRGAT